MTALATSLVSARVGLGFSIILSIIWVATMTGLAALLHFSTSLFCTIGTSSIHISTPRSPRATMMASVAKMMASIFSIASGFSIFALMRAADLYSLMIPLVASTTFAFLTQDRAV